MSYPGPDTDMLEEVASGLSVDTEGLTEDRDNSGDNEEEMAVDDSTDHEDSMLSLREYRSRILQYAGTVLIRLRYQERKAETQKGIAKIL